MSSAPSGSGASPIDPPKRQQSTSHDRAIGYDCSRIELGRRQRLGRLCSFYHGSGPTPSAVHQGARYSIQATGPHRLRYACCPASKVRLSEAVRIVSTGNAGQAGQEKQSSGSSKSTPAMGQLACVQRRQAGRKRCRAPSRICRPGSANPIAIVPAGVGSSKSKLR